MLARPDSLTRAARFARSPGKWQRRWVVLSPEKQKLYYFAHPEENPARGTASLVGCHVFPEVFEDGEFDELAFKLVFKQAPGQAAGLDLPFSFGGKTKQAAALTLRAGSAGTKAEWLDMVGKTILGESDVRGAGGKGSGGLGAQVDLVVDASGKAERKISSQVFEDEDGSKGEKEGATRGDSERRRPKRRGKSLASFSIGKRGIEEAVDGELDDGGDDEGQSMDRSELISDEALADELALFEEVSAQAEQALPSAEEAIMLECISQAVRSYMLDSQRLIVEQASKIVKDGMLPFKHARELHDELLGVVLAE